MSKLFFTFIIILFAIAIGFIVQKDPGYVLLAYNGWTLETSIWVAALSALLIFFLIYFLLRLLHHIFNLDLRWRNWWQKRRHHKMHEKMELGIYQSLQGKWAKAEKKFVRAVRLDNNRVIAYLGAAYCANQVGAIDRRDEYLNSAKQAEPELSAIVEWAQARLLLQSHDWVEAEKVLLQIKEKEPKNKIILQLLKEIEKNKAAGFAL